MLDKKDISAILSALLTRIHTVMSLLLFSLLNMHAQSYFTTANNNCPHRNIINEINVMIAIKFQA